MRQRARVTAEIERAVELSANIVELVDQALGDFSEQKSGRS